MTAAELVDQVRASGVQMTLTPSGRLKLSGDQDAIEPWLSVVGKWQFLLIAELTAQAESGPMDGDHLPAAMSASPDAGRRALEPIFDSPTRKDGND